jgi:hypothetical protein
MSNETGALYRRHAAACVKIAQELTDPGRRVSLLDMARTWIALAQRSEATRAAHLQQQHAKGDDT